MTYTITFKNESLGNIEAKGLEYLESRKEDFEYYMNNGFNDSDDKQYNEDLPCFFDYGLSFDEVEIEKTKCPVCGCEESCYWENDFECCKECGKVFPAFYYRYQLSWGGPSDEIRFYSDGKIIYAYLDWLCGIGFDITNEPWAEWLKDFFVDCESIKF